MEDLDESIRFSTNKRHLLIVDFGIRIMMNCCKDGLTLLWAIEI